MVPADMASTPATQPPAPNPRAPSEAEPGGDAALVPFGGAVDGPPGSPAASPAGPPPGSPVGAPPGSPAGPPPGSPVGLPPGPPPPRPDLPPDLRPVELLIAGIPDQESAATVARQLSAIERVTATIDAATGRAVVYTPPSISDDFLLAAINSAGYHASLVSTGRRGLPARVQRGAAVPATVPAAAPAATERPGPDGGDDRRVRDMRNRLVGSFVLTLPVVALTTVEPLQFTHWQWISFALAAPVVTRGALPFHRASIAGLARGRVGAEVLASLGVLAAFGWSAYALLTGPAGAPGVRQHPTLTVDQSAGASTLYLEVATVVTTVLLVARYAETRAQRRAGAAVQALLELGANEVAVLRHGREQRVPVERLATGDLFVVRSGERIAVDGVVVEGRSVVDATRLIGSPTPTEVGLGDLVLGGSVNVGLPLVVRATHVGSRTQLARMVQLVTDAPETSGGAFPVIERLAAAFVPAVLLLAVGTLGWWLGGGASPATAIAAAVAVLVIASPTAVVHAVPTALHAGAGRAAQFGILFRPRAVLRASRRLDAVLLAKTGTLTTGRTSLLEVVSIPGERPENVLRLAGAAEYGIPHPIAQAIAAGAHDWVGPLPPARDHVVLPGRGVRAMVGAHEVLVGRFALLAERGVVLPDQLEQARQAAEGRGRSAVGVAWDGRARAVLAVGEEIRPTSAQATRQLRALGLHTVMVTGDDTTVARALARAVGVDEVVAEVPPHEKAEVVHWMQSRHRAVAMVGDRGDDAAALQRADLGVAVGPVADPTDATDGGAGSDTADVVLVRGDLRALVEVIRLARRIRGAVRRSLTWGLVYHLVALPPAVIGLVNPMLAAAAMTLSVLVAASFTARLHRFVPLPAHTAGAAPPELMA
jgi:Cu+-exporting ATPase